MDRREAENSGEYGDHMRVDASVMHDVVEHAPVWIQRRLAPKMTVDTTAEVIERDTPPALTDTPSALAASIAEAASEEVIAQTPSDSGIQKGEI